MNSDLFMSIYNERSAIADVAREIILSEKVSRKAVDKLLEIVKNEAETLQMHDALEKLYFAGLLYG